MKSNVSFNNDLDILLEINEEQSINNVEVNVSKELEIKLDENILPLELEMEVSTDLVIKLDEGSGGILPYYQGTYNVIPKVIEQKLETKNKSMTDDVTIEKIPYNETHNKTGVTVTIGGVL